MENEPSRPPTLCTGKSATKFCLVYFATLLVLLLIFTAFNNEPMDSDQTVWWWAFIASLLASATMSITALFILLYSDSKPAEAGDLDLEQNRTNIPVLAASENSGSFKTILTINSQPTGEASVKFLNLTPASPPPPSQPPKSPTTVVDVPAMKKRDSRKKKNGGSNPKVSKKPVEDIPAISVIPTVDDKKKKRSKNKQNQKKR